MRLPSRLPRRQFLKVLIIAGGLAACRPALRATSLPGVETPTSAPPPTIGPTPTPLALDIRYVLENDAVAYAPDPQGCGGTRIQGSVRDEGGAGVPGLTIRLWTDEGNTPITVLTDAQGLYGLFIDLGGSLSDATFHIQVADGAGTLLLSDVVVAQAIPSCDLNQMTVDFIAAQ